MTFGCPPRLFGVHIMTMQEKKKLLRRGAVAACRRRDRAWLANGTFCRLESAVPGEWRSCPKPIASNATPSPRAGALSERGFGARRARQGNLCRGAAAGLPLRSRTRFSEIVAPRSRAACQLIRLRKSAATRELARQLGLKNRRLVWPASRR